jgi:heat shock protein HtpX
MAFIMSVAMNVGSYWFCDKLVLAAHQAKELPQDHPVYRMVESLSQEDGLPMPKVYWVPQLAPNAFATGRDPQHAVVVVTEGILRILSERELKGVLAHELSHVKNRDILVSSIAATLASSIMYLAHMLQWAGMARRSDSRQQGMNPLVMIVVVMLAPVAASLIRFAISRSRESLADHSGAHLTRDPEGLASALEKISNPQLIKQFQEETLNPDMQPAMSHLYIVNHFSAESALALFSTHPPVQERIRALRAMKV